MQTQLHYTDSLKEQIYEDFLNSIASVRAGQNSAIAFCEHEKRVRALRLKVAAAEARSAGPGSVRLISVRPKAANQG